MSPLYDRLPTTNDYSSDDDFKDKPCRHRRARPWSLRRLRKIFRPLYVLFTIVIFLCWQVTFNASYTRPPPFTPSTSETVFVAANLIDGDLIDGSWGDSLVKLVRDLGRERVFVSIYGGPAAALTRLGERLGCEHSLVAQSSDPIHLDQVPHTKLPNGEERIKRIAYLSAVRNKALAPLDTLTRPFDRVLFINDVLFTSQDALRLLWGTVPNYKAVCAADFISSWKMYDTYGTRDNEGYSLGVPLFPWFANEGAAESRRDVLAGKSAVRVKSCWGGMVAFDARYFQSPASTRQTSVHRAAGKDTLTSQGVDMPALPLRFRAEPDPFWDASECCLIHSDILALPAFSSSTHITAPSQGGIYMNPFVRVTYSASSQRKIWLAKRFERLFTLPQRIINHFAHMPRFNYRRAEREGDVVRDRVWVSEPRVVDSSEMRKNEPGPLSRRATLGTAKGPAYWATQGHYEDMERVATRGGYCGVRQLLVLKEEAVEQEGAVGGNWDNLLDMVPPLEVR